MDADRFDALSRFISPFASRRGLISGLLAVLPVALAGEEAVARKRRKRKKRRKKQQPCIPTCAGKVCGGDGCGGICGFECTNGRVCQSGICGCPGNGVFCVDHCCPPGQDCLANGSCARPCTKTADCPSSCNCGSGSTEGTKFCIVPPQNGCAGIPQTCPTSTSECDPGHVCQATPPCLSNRCWSLCLG